MYITIIIIITIIVMLLLLLSSLLSPLVLCFYFHHYYRCYYYYHYYWYYYFYYYYHYYYSYYMHTRIYIHIYVYIYIYIYIRTPYSCNKFTLTTWNSHIAGTWSFLSMFFGCLSTWCNGTILQSGTRQWYLMFLTTSTIMDSPWTQLKHISNSEAIYSSSKPTSVSSWPHFVRGESGLQAALTQALVPQRPVASRIPSGPKRSVAETRWVGWMSFRELSSWAVFKTFVGWWGFYEPRLYIYTYIGGCDTVCERENSGATNQGMTQGMLPWMPVQL